MTLDAMFFLGLPLQFDSETLAETGDQLLREVGQGVR
jgi:hypothetical protein